MKNLKLAGLWLVTVVSFTFLSDVVNNPVNGWLQLLFVLSWFSLFTYTAIKTKNHIINEN